MADWKKIKAEYIAGNISYRKLAEKYSVSFSTLRGFAEREKWTELRAQAQHKSNINLVNSIGKQNGSYKVSVYDVADALLEKIKEMMNQEGLTTQNIKHLTSAIKDIRDVKGIKSDMDLKEQEARIKKLEKEIEGDNADKSITISFEKEGEDYAV